MEVRLTPSTPADPGEPQGPGPPDTLIWRLNCTVWSVQFKSKIMTFSIQYYTKMS